MLSSLESQQVSQNCFVFDGVSITLHMSWEFASRSLGSLCLGIVDVSVDRHVSQHDCIVCLLLVIWWNYVNAEVDARKRV